MWSQENTREDKPSLVDGWLDGCSGSHVGQNQSSRGTESSAGVRQPKWYLQKQQNTGLYID